MSAHVAVLAARLSEAVPDKVHVTLIDRNDAFMFGYCDTAPDLRSRIGVDNEGRA